MVAAMKCMKAMKARKAMTAMKAMKTTKKPATKLAQAKPPVAKAKSECVGKGQARGTVDGVSTASRRVARGPSRDSDADLVDGVATASSFTSVEEAPVGGDGVSTEANIGDGGDGGAAGSGAAAGDILGC